ncbi:histidine kinase [Algoriphagus lacus]|uniref:histidine kinase n=1 Tax=Algoriphagus lacus TaxID=2056311 RepID=A0A418PWG4_9BACT|nr:ATP-binding protein [Algoriphagus lacus]RIW18524.1 histidine kinase [Algoriphagus lacus]
MLEQDNELAFLIVSGTFLTALMGTFIVAMVVLHRQRQVQNRQKIDQLKVEYEKTLLNIENEIQQETLTQVGRELHDNIGQLLSLAKLNLNSSKPEKQAEGKDYINQIIKEVRALSKTLNLDWVESITMDEFISHQLERIQSTGFCKTSLDSDHSFNQLPKDQKLILIRVIQECLNNAIKHAQPDTISIRIYQKGSKRSIEIKDDGKGFDSSIKTNGSGLYNLSKRMETVGGKFNLTSVVGKGTLITLELPL